MKEIEFDAGLLDRVRSLQVVSAVQEVFGQPHRHEGTGLRKLIKGHYEVRLGLGQRLVFEDRGHVLYFKMLGNHDQVRRFLKGL